MSTSNQVIVNLAAIKRNFLKLKSMVNDNTICMAVVKADAYGLGALKVANYLEKEADAFCVALPEEAKELNEAGIKKNILCLGFIPEEWDEYFIKNSIRPTVFNLETAQRLDKKAEKLSIKAPIHLALDTGHARIGFMWDDSKLLEKISSIAGLKHISIEGLYSHFATADEEDQTFYEIQMKRFNETTEKIEKNGIHIPIKHLANDASIMRKPSLTYDAIRLGIGIYGQYPSQFIKQKYPIALEPVFSWRCRITNIKLIKKGTTVSYGRKWSAPQDSIILTLQNGYADGYNRLLTNKADVLINGRRCPQVGTICMDQMMVDASKLLPEQIAIPEKNLIQKLPIKIADYVYLVGPDLGLPLDKQDRPITTDELAESTSTISYEILTSIGKRVSRCYIEQ